MRIAVLGPLEVRRDTGDPVAVPGAKERLLLAVLAASTPDVVSTDRIVESLWNGGRPTGARSSLQVHLVHLRSALEPERPRGSTGRYILRRGTGYSLAADREDVDALRFTDLAARGRAQLGAGDATEAVRTLSEALTLWRGEPYADWPDAAFADAERRRLAEVRAGALTALLEGRLALGKAADVVPELERLLADDSLQEEWWRLLVLALYRSGRPGDALAAAQRARRTLAEELGTDPGPRLRAVEAAVLAQDPALEVLSAASPSSSAGSPPGADVATCPYKGLTTYEAADAALFHGRGRLVSHLVARLVDAPLLVVSGPSGAGKSSVVRAGLVPALAQDALPGSAGWRAVVLTPGRRPVDALAALTGESPPDAPIVLVYDQFEELWAPPVDPAERTALLDTVLGLLADRIVVRCVVVVRADHVGLLAEHTALAERVSSGLVLVPPLADDELRDVVIEPATVVGLEVEPELVDAVVADVRGRPGALPLLSTALVGTWERRRGHRLTLAGYMEAGGVAGALTRSAEAAYTTLDELARDVARRLLVRLADTDEAGALVRRPAPLAELDLEGDGGDVRRGVIESFVARRLLTLDGERLDVAHEALLTAWPRLSRWLEDDTIGRAVRRHLTPAAQEWQRDGEPEDELLRGPRLAAALDWAVDHEADMTPVERQFLDASKRRADAELTEARERIQREVTARRRTRRLAAGLAAVLVVALVAAGLAAVSRRTAQRTSLIADANRLAALSATVDTLDLSYLLAAQGYRLADTPQTRDALLSVLAQHRRAERAVPFAGGAQGEALANGGSTVFIGGGPRILSWDVSSGSLPRVVLDLTPEWAGWGIAAPSPTDDVWATAGYGGDGPWVRLVSEDGAVRPVPGGDAIGGVPMAMTYTPGGDLLRVVVAPAPDAKDPYGWRLVTLSPAGGGPRETGIAGDTPAPVGTLRATLSEDGGTVVFWADDPSVRPVLVELATGRQVRLELRTREDAIPDIDYRAFSTGAVQMWIDGTLVLYDRSGRVVQEISSQHEPVYDVEMAPDGTWAVTGGENGQLLVWDVDPGTGRWSLRESLDGHAGRIVEVEIDPTGRRLFTESTDFTLIVWDVSADGGFGTALPGIPSRWIASRPEVVEPGRLVVAPTRFVGTVRQGIPYLGGDTVGVAATFLDPRTGRVVEQVDVGDTLPDAYFGAGVAVSPDHRLVAVTAGLATTILDTRTRKVVDRIALPPAWHTTPAGDLVPDGAVCCAVWSKDGSRLLLGTGGPLPGLAADAAPRTKGAIAVVDTSTWDVTSRVVVDRVPEVMTLSRDGRLLAMAAVNSKDVEILDAESLEVRNRVALGVDDSLWAMSFSRDGRWLAAAGEKGNVYVADTTSWQAREPVLVHVDGHAQQVEWLSDNRTVVTTGQSGEVVLFDAVRGVVRGSLPASVDSAPGYGHVVPDPEDELVVLDDEHAGLTYPLDPQVWLREACGIAGRDLTPTEWDRYLPGRPWQPTCSDLG